MIEALSKVIKRMCDPLEVMRACVLLPTCRRSGRRTHSPLATRRLKPLKSCVASSDRADLQGWTQFEPLFRLTDSPALG